MVDLPDDVAAALLRGIGTYIRELPPHELPPSLRRYRSFRPQALNAHRKTLLAALDDDATRARIGHWLEAEKPPLSKDDARILSVATERTDGWEDELSATSKPRPRKDAPAPSDDAKLDAERDKTRKAKEELKRSREEVRSVQKESAARIAELESTVADLERRAAAAEKEAAEARKSSDAAVEKAERTERKSRSAAEKAKAERDEARKEAKELRRQVAALTKDLAAAKPKPPASAKKRTSPKEPRERKPLRVPKGRLGDDPATLERWLARDDVRLVVDGYNVAKADGGYEDLQLESQRERLVEALFTLAKMTGTETIVVFDAQRVPGRRARRTRRPVVIEWSNPGQIADDYIVARLEELPPDPVVLVTNDRELQERGRALGATIATSQQLLALLR